MAEININSLSEQEVVKRLESYGIGVIYVPMALTPDSIQNSKEIGRNPNGDIKVDIYI